MFYRRGLQILGSALGNLLYPLLLTKLISSLFISWPISLTIKSLSNQPMFPLQPPLYICIRLYILRLLRPFYKSPYIYIRLYIPHLLRPSYKLPFNTIGPLKLAYISTLLSHLVAIALPLYCYRVTIVQVTRTTPIKTLF